MVDFSDEGKACFSPRVSKAIVKLWEDHQGLVVQCDQDFREMQHMFCVGPKDPFLSSLRSRNIQVLYAKWIHDCVKSDFRLPTEPYILDEFFDVSRTFRYYDTSSNNRAHSVYPEDVKNAAYMHCASDEEHLVQALKANNKRQISDDPNNDTLRTTNTKKSRIQPIPEESIALNSGHPCENDNSTSFSSNEASLDHTLVEDDNIRDPKAKQILQGKDHTTNDHIPVVDSVGQERNPDDLQKSRLKRTPLFPLLDLKIFRTPGPKRRAEAATFKFKPLRKIGWQTQFALNEPDPTHTKFWNQIREQHTVGEPIVVTMDDLLKSNDPSTNTKLFTINGSYEGLEFKSIKLPPQRPYFSPPLST